MAKDLWPADLHLIGKEIVRFHAVYWPAFLMAAGLPLPKRIFAHGWLLFENDKMSKSRGNIVRAEPIRQVMGADALRYFLLREIVFGQDGSFSYDALIGRYNSDLANGLGNLASRTLTMIHQYRGGEIPEGSDPEIAAAGQRDRRSRAEALRRLRILQGPGSRLGADLRGRQVHRAEGALEAGATDRPGVADRARARRSTPPPKPAHRHRAALPGAAGVGAEDLGAARHARTHRRGALRHARMGRSCSPARRSARSPASSRAST